MGLAIVSLSWVLGSYELYDPFEKERQSSIVADTNKDGITTEEEWQGVYRELGIQYDTRNPKTLTNSDLEKYLSMHQEEIESSSR